jgi:hypothetical protein
MPAPFQRLLLEVQITARLITRSAANQRYHNGSQEEWDTIGANRGANMKSVWIPGLAVALTAGTLMAADEVAAVDKALVAA